MPRSALPVAGCSPRMGPHPCTAAQAPHLAGGHAAHVVIKNAAQEKHGHGRGVAGRKAWHVHDCDVEPLGVAAVVLHHDAVQVGKKPRGAGPGGDEA